MCFPFQETSSKLKKKKKSYGAHFQSRAGLRGWWFLAPCLSLTSVEIACLPMQLWYHALKIHSERLDFWKQCCQVPLWTQGLGLMQSSHIPSLAGFDSMEVSGATPERRLHIHRKIMDILNE